MYKLNLDDDSFIIADENYKLTLFYNGLKKIITIKDYLYNNKYEKYHLLDMIDGKKIKRFFTIEPIENTEFPIGSRLKLAKDIKINDLVMGEDNKPRKVTELHTGQDEMYEIMIEGMSYVVNGGHILALVDKDTNEHLEIPVNVYMHMNDEFKSHYVMEKIVD